jgi:hypothetical protein
MWHALIDWSVVDLIDVPSLAAVVKNRLFTPRRRPALWQARACRLAR